ncbi:MAG TPA: SCO family protein [Vicinamibacterales bacterium]
MRFRFVVALALAAASCGPREPQKAYTLNGQVLSLDAPHRQLTIKHDEIKGLMPAMTMPYSVRDEKLLAGISPGDLVDATLVIVSNDAYLTTIKKVGHADVPPPPPDAPMPAAASGFELLKPGEAVPDAAFVDQDGRKRTFDSFKGSTVVMTFIYTRCPLPTFCPLMDRHFAAMQTPLKEDPALKGVHLVTVTFDPATDTPPVLKKHARALNADLSRWTFLTGDRDAIDRFAARFGVSVSRAMNDPNDITHNLRTVIIDKDGKLVKSYTGNDWTPAQILDELHRV